MQSVLYILIFIILSINLVNKKENFFTTLFKQLTIMSD